MVDFKKQLEELKPTILGDLKHLLQIPSVLDESVLLKDEEAPFGKGIRDALDFMMELGKKEGFEVIKDKGYAGSLSYGNGEKTLGILCHLDVVPVGDGWMYPPYEAHIADGKIYARGSIDDKGPTMAAFYALKMIKDQGIKLKNKVQIIFGTDEETGWRGISHYLTNYPKPDFGFAPDASFPLIYGEKGRMSYDLAGNYQDDLIVEIKGGERYNVVLEEVTAILTKDLSKEAIAYAKGIDRLEVKASKEGDYYKLIFKGVAAHAMEPFMGVNAGTHLCNFLKDYTNHPLIQYVAKYHHLDFFFQNHHLDYDDYEMGKITCNIGIFEIDKNHSRLTLDIRFPVRLDLENFEKVFAETAKESHIEITDHHVKMPHYVSPESNLVKKLYEAYLKITGDVEHKPFTIGGGTYASILGEAVAFGMVFPYEEDLCHQRNEYMCLDSFYKSILIYTEAILSLGEIDA